MTGTAALPARETRGGRLLFTDTGSYEQRCLASGPLALSTAKHKTREEDSRKHEAVTDSGAATRDASHL